MSVHDVIAALGQLSPEERKQVLAAAQMLNKGAVQATQPSSRAELLWTALVRAALEARGVKLPHAGIVRRMRLWAQYVEHAEAFDKWLDSACPGLDETERVRVYKLAAAALVRDVQQYAPVMAPVLMRSVRDAAPILDREFPGYAKAGLLRRFLLQD